MTKRSLIIFSKTPLAGSTKTRMQPFLTPSQCVELHTAVLADLLLEAKKLYQSCPGLTVEVFYQGDSKEAFVGTFSQELTSFLQANPLPNKYLEEIGNFMAKTIKFTPQAQGDLGKKMSLGFDQALGQNQQAILLGSDCPQITAPALAAAFAALDQADCVLGPANDGGYYLIGLNAPCPILFENMAWSTPTVCQTTMKKGQNLGMTIKTLPTLIDLDEKSDLLELTHQLATKKATSIILTEAFIASLGSICYN